MIDEEEVVVMMMMALDAREGSRPKLGGDGQFFALQFAASANG